jgi:hypothetical protein
MRRWSSSITLVTVLCCGLIPVTRAGQRTAQMRPLTKEQWREDLRYFARELPRRHKNLFHATSREQFERSVAELHEEIPTLQGHQIVVRMK